MKVTGNNRMEALKIYGENRPKAADGMGKANKKFDSIEISKAGQEISKYANAVGEISDVRIQRVNDIKSRIQDGTYKVSTDDLAKEILKIINEGK